MGWKEVGGKEGIGVLERGGREGRGWWGGVLPSSFHTTKPFLPPFHSPYHQRLLSTSISPPQPFPLLLSTSHSSIPSFPPVSTCRPFPFLLSHRHLRHLFYSLSYISISLSHCLHFCPTAPTPSIPIQPLPSLPGPAWHDPSCPSPPLQLAFSYRHHPTPSSYAYVCIIPSRLRIFFITKVPSLVY